MLPRNLEHQRIQKAQRVLALNRRYDRARDLDFPQVDDFGCKDALHKSNHATVRRRFSAGQVKLAASDNPAAEFRIA